MKAENVTIHALFTRQIHANQFVLQFISDKIVIGFWSTAAYDLRHESSIWKMTFLALANLCMA